MEKHDLKTAVVTAEDLLYPTEEMEAKIAEFQEAFLYYRSAIKEVRTKLDILSDEFQAIRKRNPIEYMKSRVKSPKSIVEKMKRKGCPITSGSIKQNLNDIAGIRVVCSFVDDIYTIAHMLMEQSDITLLEKKDYIKNPKQNGYRSLHIVIEVPVFFSDHMEKVKVEVQIRTIAMDFWASLEHKLHYKSSAGKSHEEIIWELQSIAEVIAVTDKKMWEIRDMLEQIE